jgi:hypothetical protein
VKTVQNKVENDTLGYLGVLTDSKKKMSARADSNGDSSDVEVAEGEKTEY